MVPKDYDMSYDILSREAEQRFEFPAWMVGGAILICASMVFIFGCQKPAAAAEYNDKNAILAIIGEAEGEGEWGMMAMACAISNRGTLNGVYGVNSPRVTKKLYSKAIYAQAEAAWNASQSPDGYYACREIIGTADHWGGTQIDGHWIAKMKAKGYVQTAKVGNTVFFKRGAK